MKLIEVMPNTFTGRTFLSLIGLCLFACSEKFETETATHGGNETSGCGYAG
jgi:hypothetical protein